MPGKPHHFAIGLVALCAIAFTSVAIRNSTRPETLRVGYNSYPPFILPRETGRPTGVASEVVALAAARAGVRLEWINLGATGADEALREGRIDLFPLLTVTAEREAQYHFSHVWWQNENALISLENRTIRTAAETAGKRIATRGMLVMQRIAEKVFPQARLVRITQMERMPEALCRGEIDAFFLDMGLTYSQLLKGPAACAGTPLFVAPIPSGAVALATAASPAKKKTAGRIYRQIANLALEGTLSEIAAQWALYHPYKNPGFREGLEAEHREDFLRYGLGIMTAVAVLVGMQARRLRKAHAAAEAARKESEESQYRFNAFMTNTPAVTYIKDIVGRYLFVNQAFCRQFHRTPEEMKEKTGFDIWPHEFARRLLENDCGVLAQEKSQEFVETVCDPEGNLRHYLSLKFPFINRSGERFIGGVSLDITEKKQAEETLRLSQFSIDRSPDMILWLDAEGRLIYANEAACAALGYSREEMLRLELRNIDPVYGREAFLLVHEELRSSGSRTIEAVYRTRNGRSFPVEARFNFLEFDGRGFICCMARDITERKRAEGELERQAQHDLLTGLPNRRRLESRLERELSSQYCVTPKPVGVVYLDLDGFKFVNDTLGHAIGDGLLKEAALRLESCIESRGTLARMGGDEFAVVVPRLESERDLERLAQCMLSCLQEGFIVEGHELLVTASIGISVFPRDGSDVSSLLQTSDAAMYEAKRQGKNRIQFFTPEMGVAARERLELENLLRRALEREELALHYQPQIVPRTGEVGRFEALLRWNQPALGSVAPARFIPIAEETSLIVPIGTWALEQACKDARKWQAEGVFVGVGVNVSAVQFVRPDFVETVIDILDRTGLRPGSLELELTESVVMQGFDEMAAKIAQLRLLGVSISIDDFGTGYSSLSYLQKLPIDRLKVDRSFIREIATSAHAVSLTEALVSLAHCLGVQVVVEGIETRQQYDAICRIGCDLAQGYLLGRPQPIEDALAANCGAGVSACALAS